MENRIGFEREEIQQDSYRSLETLIAVLQTGEGVLVTQWAAEAMEAYLSFPLEEGPPVKTVLVSKSDLGLPEIPTPHYRILSAAMKLGLGFCDIRMGVDYARQKGPTLPPKSWVNIALDEAMRPNRHQPFIFAVSNVKGGVTLSICPHRPMRKCRPGDLWLFKDLRDEEE